MPTMESKDAGQETITVLAVCPTCSEKYQRVIPVPLVSAVAPKPCPACEAWNDVMIHADPLPRLDASMRCNEWAKEHRALMHRYERKKGEMEMEMDAGLETFNQEQAT